MSLEVIVDDGEDSTSYQILLVINEPIVIEMEGVEIVEEEEVIEEATTESESSSSGSASSGSTSSSSRSQSGDEDQDQESVDDAEINDVIDYPAFDWQAAFAALEAKRKREAEEAGEVYVAPEPPQASLKSISDRGVVSISFSQSMKPIPDLSVIQNTKAKNGKPVVEVNVLVGAYSQSDMMGYNWSVSSYSERSMEIQMDFENPIYISIEDEPEVLQFICNDGSVFLSVDELPLQLEI